MLSWLSKKFTFVIVLFVLGGCSFSKNEQTTNSCKKYQKPLWVNDSFVGVARITASGDKTYQKQIALNRAIATLIMTKGSVYGESLLSLEKSLLKEDKKEVLKKTFEEDSVMYIKYQQIDYNIAITDIWEDPCTKEIYVRIKER